MKSQAKSQSQSKITTRSAIAENLRELSDKRRIIISAQRKIKPILKRLRHVTISHSSIDHSSWDKSLDATCYIFISRKVYSMKDCENLLAKIDDCPGELDTYQDPTKHGWETEDSKHAGTRSFTRVFIWRRIRIYIQVTAIPLEKSDAAGQVPKCRRVVIGEKETVTKSPIYEIVCEE